MVKQDASPKNPKISNSLHHTLRYPPVYFYYFIGCIIIYFFHFWTVISTASSPQETEALEILSSLNWPATGAVVCRDLDCVGAQQPVGKLRFLPSLGGKKKISKYKH